MCHYEFSYYPIDNGTSFLGLYQSDHQYETSDFNLIWFHENLMLVSEKKNTVLALRFHSVIINFIIPYSTQRKICKIRSVVCHKSIESEIKLFYPNSIVIYNFIIEYDITISCLQGHHGIYDYTIYRSIMFIVLIWWVKTMKSL